jgi:hypothetical protein
VSAGGGVAVDPVEPVEGVELTVEGVVDVVC